MRVRLDECMPHGLRPLLAAHDVWTVRRMGWLGQKNGDLLALIAGAGFEVLLTVDKNLQYQQPLAAAGVAVVVMDARTNTMADLAPLGPAVLAALAGPINPGDVIEVR